MYYTLLELPQEAEVSVAVWGLCWALAGGFVGRDALMRARRGWKAIAIVPLAIGLGMAVASFTPVLTWVEAALLAGTAAYLGSMLRSLKA